MPRRLPQLSLKLTLLAPHESSRPSIGVLARPVGTEFYSRVLGLPDTITPPFKAEFPLLMRGRGATDAALLPEFERYGLRRTALPVTTWPQTVEVWLHTIHILQ